MLAAHGLPTSDVGNLSATVIYIIENLPINPNQPDELIQTALASYDVISVSPPSPVVKRGLIFPLQAIEGIRKWDTWLAAHLIDMLDKLDELEDQMETDTQNPEYVFLLSLLLWGDHGSLILINLALFRYEHLHSSLMQCTFILIRLSGVSHWSTSRPVVQREEARLQRCCAAFLLTSNCLLRNRKRRNGQMAY